LGLQAVLEAARAVHQVVVFEDRLVGQQDLDG
jgi:hypothetical protein